MLMSMKTLRRIVSAAMAWVLCACAPLPPAPGLARAELLQTWGAPTARYALEDGTVITNNLREFQRVPGLKVEDWS